MAKIGSYFEIKANVVSCVNKRKKHSVILKKYINEKAISIQKEAQPVGT